MIRIAPLGRALAVAAAASLALTACGGGGDTATPADTAARGVHGAGRGGRRATAHSPLAPCCRRPVSWPSSARPSSPASTSRSRRSTKRAACSASRSRKIDTDSGDTTTNIASQSVDKLLSAEGRRHHRRGVLGCVVNGHRQDHRRWRGPVLAGQHLDEFTTYHDKGLYFRTAPPDVLQGRVLGDLIIAGRHDTLAHPRPPGRLRHRPGRRRRRRPSRTAAARSSRSVDLRPEGRRLLRRRRARSRRRTRRRSR